MDYTKFRRFLLNKVKQVHPDVNKKPTAAAKTRFLLKLISFLPLMELQGGLYVSQIRELSKELRDV